MPCKVQLYLGESWSSFYREELVVKAIRGLWMNYEQRRVAEMTE